MLHLLRRTPAVTLSLLVACNSADDGGGTPTDADTETDAGTTTTTEQDDTGWPPGDVGSMMIVEDSRGLQLFAMFVNQQPGYENLAYCAVAGTACIAGFPPDLDVPGDSFDPTLRFDPVFSQYRYVGDAVSLGDYVADLYYNAETGLAYYYGDLRSTGPVLGPVGLTFGGQWGDYSGTEDIVLKDPIEVILPIAGQVRTTNGAYLPIEWIPEPDGGDLHLFATTGEPNYYGHQWWVQDDGYFEVPIDDILGGSPTPETISFTLQRWNQATVSHRGHTLEIVQVTDVDFSADYDYVGSRTFLAPSDTCAEAVNNIVIDAVGSYSYWGQMLNYDEDIPDQCGLGLGNGAGLVAVSLPPLSALAVEYNLPLGSEAIIAPIRDAALWITSDCNVDGACLAGSNANVEYIPELVSYFNPDPVNPLVVYLVLGGTDATGDIFWLDVVVSQLGDPDLADECLEATQSAGLPEGGYYSEVVAFLDSLNPGLACTNSQTPGPDAMNKVTLADGQTLTASVQMIGADPALYLMYNCTQPQTCVVGADTNFGVMEQLAYTNLSGVSENLYVVIDTKGGPMTPYFLTLDISP